MKVRLGESFTLTQFLKGGNTKNKLINKKEIIKKYLLGKKKNSKVPTGISNR